MTPPISEVAAVILDMDGLMLDTESIYKRSWQTAAGQCGYSLDDDFYFTLIGQPNPACESALLERYGPDFPMAEFRSRWSGLWRADVESSGIPTKPGLMRLLSFLAGRQIPTAIATSSDHEYATFSLRAGGLEGRFTQIVTGDQVVSGKPAPDIYVMSARRLGVAAERCVAIEDSDAGVLAANAAGMIPLMVPDLKEPSAKARAAAYRVVASLLDARDVLASLMRDARGSAD
jgi:beta-phosphoglucomutase-like phosphatase (HAD superfamily)